MTMMMMMMEVVSEVFFSSLPCCLLPCLSLLIFYPIPCLISPRLSLIYCASQFLFPVWLASRLKRSIRINARVEMGRLRRGNSMDAFLKPMLPFVPSQSAKGDRWPPRACFVCRRPVRLGSPVGFHSF